MSTMKIQVDSDLGLTIPTNLAKELGITPNSVVAIRRIGRTIAISVPRDTTSLEDLLRQVNETNRHGETDTGPAVGRETW